MEKIRILKYPEQIKSLRKLLHSMDKVYNEIEKETATNVERLKKIIWNEPEVLLYFIADNNEDDDLTLVSERWFISSVLLDEKFLRLLAKESLTNRIEQVYNKYEITEGVQYRIRECIIAFDVYSTIIEDEIEL